MPRPVVLHTSSSRMCQQNKLVAEVHFMQQQQDDSSSTVGSSIPERDASMTASTLTFPAPSLLSSMWRLCGRSSSSKATTIFSLNTSGDQKKCGRVAVMKRPPARINGTLGCTSKCPC
ncbi:uncharacterized protein LOC125554054 [Triticum urartu]|uniref:uncharacterized protein LOC125554054 n=1 Tax=Triticum urartu TaxID=4572 RepID=UPI002042C84B|nr:uncharacterized protein LOC125554054 [Triticum urartu]